MSNKIVPTISSGVAGPLGVLHLPRFWQKASLDAVGKLHDDYPACGDGFDAMTLEAVGVDKDTALAYINDNKPSYTAFETWIKENGSVSEEATAKHNEAVTGYCHDDETRGEILGAADLNDDCCSYRDAVNLNNLDDWTTFHAEEIA